MSRIRGYLINLDSGETRRRTASACLGAEQIGFERVSAIDGRKLNLKNLTRYRADKAVRTFGRELAAGEVGCYFSHLECLQRFLRSDARYCLVMEDDVTTRPGSGRLLENLLDLLDTEVLGDTAVVNLANPARMVVSSLQRVGELDGAPIDLRKAYYFPISAAALLWSRKAVVKFVAEYSCAAMPYDAAVRTLCIAGNFGYDLSTAILRPAVSESEIDKCAPRVFARSFHRWQVIQRWRMAHLIKARVNKFRDRLASVA